jgi:four helix bundle protein
MEKNLGHYQKLLVYQKAFSLSVEIFHLTKSFPSDEKYSLISQIRRSSRSVCSNIVEGYRKRQYPAHFVSKLTDADMENSETEGWIDFVESCDYINAKQKNKLKIQVNEIGRLLNFMIQNPKKFL